MHNKYFRFITAAAALLLAVVTFKHATPAQAGIPSYGYSVLSPIQQGNLTIFPVVANNNRNTREFLTLDEGLRSGEVVVTEEGATGLVRPRDGRPVYQPRSGAQVNQLALMNNSKRPLLLLAGEIVTGGRQDRIVGKDLIIPPGEQSDLGVFCVEPGRWTARSEQFGVAGKEAMAQPSIRVQAMANQNQEKVWDEVRKSQSAMSANVMREGGLSAAAPLAQTSSYAQVIQNEAVQKQVDSIAAPIQRTYGDAIRELRSRNAVGVVVAVNGRIIWADIFASSDLLQKYWLKLVRSYAAEAVEYAQNNDSVTVGAAADFLARLNGLHESSDTSPGIYRYSEITGGNYKVFRLTSLLPDTGFDVHVAKMAD